MSLEHGVDGRDPDEIVAQGLEKLIQTLRDRQAGVERAVKHKKTLDKIIPKLDRIVAEVRGNGAGSSNGQPSEAAARQARVADATDAIIEVLEKGDATRAEIRRSTGLHPKTLDAALRSMDQEGAIEHDGEKIALLPGGA